MIETSLYFGQSKPDGSKISDKEWQSFKESQITRIFPEGSTLYNAVGNWLDPVNHKQVTENTYVVVFYYRKSPLKSLQIDSLISDYKLKFQQQSVLRVDQQVRATF